MATSKMILSIAPFKIKQNILLTQPLMLQVTGRPTIVRPTMWVTTIQHQSYLPQILYLRPTLQRAIKHISNRLRSPSLRGRGLQEAS